MVMLRGASAKLRILRAGNRLFRDDSGQAVTEYVLLLSMTLTGTVLIARGILGLLDTITAHFGGQLEKDLKTGRAPISVFSN